jgi:hypothetical protein
MKRLQDVIRETEERLFVGREQELEIMEKALLDTKVSWRLLHFYGPAGIGKTSLLRAFIRRVRDFDIFYFDQLSCAPKVSEFLHRLGSMVTVKGYEIQGTPEEELSVRLVEYLNDLAMKKNLVILLFDTYEQWTPLEDWLHEVWLPMLVPQIKICSAGQFSLMKNQTRSPGWEELIYNVEIPPLSKNEVKMYSKMKGITDQLVQNEIEQFSGGVPLAVSLACEVVLQQGSEKLMDNVQKRKTIEPLIEKLFQNMKNDSFQKLLEVTSLLWRFDQDLLAMIANEPISNVSFREFCRLPFITVCDRGWTLHDTVRQWTRMDFLHRAPERYALYRNKALKELRLREIMTTGTEKIHYAVEKLYLHEDDSLQNLLFNAHGDGMPIRHMQKEDVPQVIAIYQLWSQSNAPFIQDDTYQERFILPLLELEPSAFYTVWEGNKLIGFHSFVPLNEATRKVFLQNPVFSNYIQKTKSKGMEFVAWIGGVLPGNERKVMGLQLRHLIDLFANAHQIVGIGPFPELKAVLLSMGFEPIQWADYVSQNGALHWYALQLNLKDSNFLSRLDKLLETINGCPSVPLEDVTELVKKALIHFESLEQQTDLLVVVKNLLLLNIASSEGETPVAVIRKLLIESINEMTAEKNGEKVLPRILQLAYIKKIGPHELVADHLALSISTYYRYLKKAMTRLTLTICKRCSIETTQGGK